MEVVRTHLAAKSFFECVICRQVYQDPRNLPCGHTFCLKCIEGTVNKVCPLCKGKWVLPNNGILGLPKNFAVDNFIVSLPSISKCALAKRNDHDHGPAAFFCVNCWDPICEKCTEVHAKSKQHVIKLLIDIDQSDIEQQETTPCVEHNNQKLTLFCMKCQQFGCHTCYVESHAKHDYVVSEEADKLLTMKIKASIKEIQENMDKKEKEIKAAQLLGDTLATDRQKLVENITSLISNVKQKVREKYEEAVNRIEECHINVIQSIDKKVNEEKVNLEKAIIDAKAKLQNLRNALSSLQNHLPPMSTASKRLKIIKEKNMSYLEEFKYSLDYPNCKLTDASEWQSALTNWLHLYMELMSATYTPLINESNIIIKSQIR